MIHVWHDLPVVSVIVTVIKSFGYKGILWIWFAFNIKIILNDKVTKAWMWLWKHDYLSSKLCLSRAKCTHVFPSFCTYVRHGKETLSLSLVLCMENPTVSYRRPVMHDFPAVFVMSLDKLLHTHLSHIWAVYLSQCNYNPILVFIIHFESDLSLLNAYLRLSMY